MMNGSVEPERVHTLNTRDVVQNPYVLYWMQQSQRAEFNPALEYAVAQANTLGLPLIVGFGLMDRYPEANLRHYTFMREGLRETARTLAARGIQFVVRRGDPPEAALALAQAAALIVCDRGYLRHQRAWRRQVADRAACRVVEVEGDLIVPVEAATNKLEVAARTLRPKLLRALPLYLKDLKPIPLARPSLGLGILMDDHCDDAPSQFAADASVPPATAFFQGGTAAAKRAFRTFLSRRFSRYAEDRNQPQTDGVSRMSPYLHFGQISPVWLARQVQARSADANVTAFIDELLVQRELSFNYVWFNPAYDSFAGLPEWARQTLARHQADPRSRQYRLADLEAARTHDAYWNAAMMEMKVTGFMHNYMRMYWGKKILEWSPTPQAAFAIALRLNNRYFLDGRDANAYANVAWIFGAHDRPWPERPIFGTVRTMTAGGLERKCDIAGYVARVGRLA